MAATQRFTREPDVDITAAPFSSQSAAGGTEQLGLPPPTSKEPSTLPHSTARPGADPADPQTRQVGRYLVKSRLGRGGMATVYRAHDPSIGRDVAIKFLHASLSEDDECRMRFLREARAAGGLSHPNIVVVHDVGEIDRRPYMAMELIDGAPLSEALDKQRTLPIRDVVVMGLELARALEYAQRQRHRSSRHQAWQHHADGRPADHQGLRLRHRPHGGDQRRAAHDDRCGDGHAAVHVARADARREGRRPLGSVFGRHRALPDDHRRAPVQG